MQSRYSLCYVWQINPLSLRAAAHQEITSPKSHSSYITGCFAHPQEVYRFTTDPISWKLVQSPLMRTLRPWWLKVRAGIIRHLLFDLLYSASLALVCKTVTYTLINPVAPKYPPGISSHIQLNNCWARSKACSQQAHGESQSNKDSTYCI